MPNLGEVLPSLRTLALTNNNLCELGDIDPLATCKKLEYLTLIGNPVTHKPQYRLYVIYKVPSVRVLDFKRVRLSERQQASAVFKGKKGQKVREQVVKRSRPLPEDERVEAAKMMRGEDARKIQEAIESASTLAEVDHLQSILQGGRIPEKGWNLPVSAPSSNAEKGGEDRDENAFVPETEDENEEKTSEEAVVNMDNSDDVEKRGNDLTSATEDSVESNDR